MSASAPGATAGTDRAGWASARRPRTRSPIPGPRPAAATLGVVRTYTTRHGAGPLVTESAALSASLPDAYNVDGPWQGGFRVGHFDAVAHRYAIEVSGGIDALAVTHADVDISGVCRAY